MIKIIKIASVLTFLVSSLHASLGDFIRAAVNSTNSDFYVVTNKLATDPLSDQETIIVSENNPNSEGTAGGWLSPLAWLNSKNYAAVSRFYRQAFADQPVRMEQYLKETSLQCNFVLANSQICFDHKIKFIEAQLKEIDKIVKGNLKTEDLASVPQYAPAYQALEVAIESFKEHLKKAFLVSIKPGTIQVRNSAMVALKDAVDSILEKGLPKFAESVDKIMPRASQEISSPLNYHFGMIMNESTFLARTLKEVLSPK